MFTATLGTVLFCSLAALVAGFIDSIAGGGGLITLPALLLAGLPPHLALGTNKMQSSMGTAVALISFANSHLVLWRVALMGLPFSLIGSGIGSNLALYLDEKLLGTILIVLLPVAMVCTIVPKKERKDANVSRGSHILVPLVCLAIGTYDGFFGPGTGSFLILAFHWIVGLGLVQASASVKVLNLASNVGALCIFLWSGQIVWAVALPMVVASIVGNWLGSRTAVRLGARAVRIFLTVSLGLLMVTLVIRTLNG